MGPIDIFLQMPQLYISFIPNPLSTPPLLHPSPQPLRNLLSHTHRQPHRPKILHNQFTLKNNLLTIPIVNFNQKHTTKNDDNYIKSDFF